MFWNKLPLLNSQSSFHLVKIYKEAIWWMLVIARMSNFQWHDNISWRQTNGELVCVCRFIFFIFFSLHHSWRIFFGFVIFVLLLLSLWSICTKLFISIIRSLAAFQHFLQLPWFHTNLVNISRIATLKLEHQVFIARNKWLQPNIIEPST